MMNVVARVCAVPDDTCKLLVRQRLISHTQDISSDQPRCYLCYLQCSVSLTVSEPIVLPQVRFRLQMPVVSSYHVMSVSFCVIGRRLRQRRPAMGNNVHAGGCSLHVQMEHQLKDMQGPQSKVAKQHWWPRLSSASLHL